MDTYHAITGEYKKQFINTIIEGMHDYCDNQILTELNKSLHYNTQNIDFADNPQLTDLDYEKTNNLLIKEFIKSKKIKGLSPKTIQYYEYTLQAFNKWCIKSFLEITTEDLKDYFIYYKECYNCTNVTLNNIRRNISSFFRFLTDEEKIIVNPIARVNQFKEQKKVKKALTYTEIESLRWRLTQKVYSKKEGISLYNLRNNAMFELLLSSGIRVGELVNIKVDDVDFDTCKIIVLGKGNKERVVFFSEKAKELLLNYLEIRDSESEYLLASTIKESPHLTISAVETTLRNLGNECNIELYPHKLRRTFATNMIKKGMSIDQVQKLLGHGSVEITLKYVEIDDEMVQLTHKKHTNF